MTKIYNDPAEFKNEVLDGFALAYPDYVRRVPGASGFIRSGGPRAGKVSLVIGGGSGHYPSYSGVTGAGFADGAVLGDVFTSPSAEQVYRVARAAHGGAGLVLAFGNYAGDRLNFAAAADRLRAEGIDVRIVYVTDDIASAPAAESGKRRGIAGTFTVYKVAGAAAERGDDLDAVERIMRAANARTFSFGVAFAGCTFPGQSRPLFAVAERTMDFGLGIHGEPGVRSDAWMPAAKIASALVEPLLAERPEGAQRAAVLLNGLGATKYEELFLLWNNVRPLLAGAGVEPVMPEVGELVTSLDMAGCSLSITWLDDELDELWRAPAHTPAFRRGSVHTAAAGHHAAPEHHVVPEEAVAADVAEQAGPESERAAAVVRDALRAMTAVVAEHEDELARIDAVAGDGDHGSGMVRGLRAALSAAEATRGGAETVLTAAASAFGDRAGGTSGVLWSLFLRTIGESLGNHEPVEPARLARAVRRGAEAMKDFGGAELGDKTMLDAVFPFADALDANLAAGSALAASWAAAARSAVEAAAATAQLVPKVGRARPLAERSVGSPDAGATSMGLILTAVGDVLAVQCG
ncbi:dihydroxyacetone kinase family protein [Nonomuraea basaltis]|uniref:dihydroxyacetone kinase family protein n=1 Tax=Nonomuraea basaltis TaxID=2495887 RepID=UPI00110C4442|nr:dihydroxyacetone kinase family protein [Nonomuraea basaltis]TMR96898.1 dihydroxyacetone kinase family protein [Nonomuraea basaltis]